MVVSSVANRVLSNLTTFSREFRHSVATLPFDKVPHTKLGKNTAIPTALFRSSSSKYFIGSGTLCNEIFFTRNIHAND